MYLMIQCHYCKKSGSKGYLKRFLLDGIKYQCGTPECDNVIKALVVEKNKARILCEEKEREEKNQLQREKWGDYIVENHNDFIIANRQYRDGCRRFIDPKTQKIFKHSMFSDIWVETNDVPNSDDLLNVSNVSNNVLEDEDDGDIGNGQNGESDYDVEGIGESDIGYSHKETPTDEFLYNIEKPTVIGSENTSIKMLVNVSTMDNTNKYKYYSISKIYKNGSKKVMYNNITNNYYYYDNESELWLIDQYLTTKQQDGVYIGDMIPLHKDKRVSCFGYKGRVAFEIINGYSIGIEHDTIVYPDMYNLNGSNYSNFELHNE